MATFDDLPNEIIAYILDIKTRNARAELLFKYTGKRDVNRVDWNSIWKSLPYYFIREFQDSVNWWFISRHQKLSEDFIREFQDYVNWTLVSQHQTLSEDFIREFKDRVNWHAITIYQKLSEDFIIEFEHFVDWFFVPLYQEFDVKRWLNLIDS